MKSEIFEIIKKAKKIHFTGIGGVSMSSLGAIAHHLGYEVTGSDDDKNNTTVEYLESLGIEIKTPLGGENIKSPDLVVRTAAVHLDNPEIAAALEKGIPVITRAEYLGYIMTEYRERIGVSGTHGKSTTTGMIHSIYTYLGTNPTTVCGAVMSGGSAYTLGDEEKFIYEACEYTDSFLCFNPTTAVILNIELDHVDYFPNIEALIRSFGRSLEGAKRAVVNYDDENCRAAVKDFGGEKIFVSPKGDENANFYVKNVEKSKGCYSFDIMSGGKLIARPTLRVPGYHNLMNGLFAFAVAYLDGFDAEACQKGLESYGGIAKRFELILTHNGAKIYSDYAHHHEELEVTLKMAREVTDEKLIAVFQPHTYSRTSMFLKEFADVLSRFDASLITELMPARETENPTGVHALDLVNMTKNAIYLPKQRDIFDYILENGKEGELYIFMGAGDITRWPERLLRELNGNKK